MCGRRVVLTSSLLLILMAARSSAQSVQTLVTYKGPDPTACTGPTATTQQFLSSDPSVNVFFFLNGVHPGDAVQLRWFDLNNIYRWYSPWDPVPNDGYSSRCYWYDLGVAQYIIPYGLGQWQVEVYVNGGAVGSPYSFWVTSSTSSSGSSPSFEGYLDGVDCNHIFGWARDKNSSGSAINVDLAIDGQKLMTIKASDYRSDLPDGGYHAFNDYSLPTSLKDGNNHAITAVVTGSSFTLSGSPKYFQNTCGNTIITNANQWTYNTDAYANPQNGWWARLVKTPVSGNRYTYSVYVFMSNGGAIQNASLAIVTDLRVGMVRGSYGTRISQVLAPQPYTTDFHWQDPPNYNQANSLTNVAFDLWGFLNYDVGLAAGAADIINSLRDLSKANVAPSSWLSNEMLDENTYRVSRVAYTPSNGMFTGLQNISGVSFNVTVDENQGLQPQFFLRAETKLGTIVGVEIGLDRNALVNTAYWF